MKSPRCRRGWSTASFGHVGFAGVAGTVSARRRDRPWRLRATLLAPPLRAPRCRPEASPSRTSSVEHSTPRCARNRFPGKPVLVRRLRSPVLMPSSPPRYLGQSPDATVRAMASPIRINRAPVLTLWAAIVAERLGHPTETALTLGRWVAGSSARAKARRLGLTEETEATTERREKAQRVRSRLPTIRLLGREIPVLPAADGALRAAEDGKIASAKRVAAYVTRAFGDHLTEVRAAMEELAASVPPEELNRIGFHLYEQFRPTVPEGVQGWGAKAELRLDRIRRAREYL